MRLLTTRRLILLVLGCVVAFSAAWLYWNRTVRSDMAGWAPADSLAFVEVNDVADLAYGTESTKAWESLAGPMGAPPTLAPNRWLIRLARWTGIGSTDAILLARSQAAIIFSGAEAAQNENTLTIKPLVTFALETHTAQTRMRAVVEHHIEDLARRVYKDPVYLRKLVASNDLQEWTSTDGSHRIVFMFADTAVVLGNDETSVLRAVESHVGMRASLAGSKELTDLRSELDAAHGSTFGFVSQSGVKSLLQGFALSRAGSSSDAVTPARIFSDTIGGTIHNIGWTASFRDGAVEDRCAVTLVDAVADKLRNSMVPERGVDTSNLSFVPPDVYSLSIYHLRDPSGFWTDLNSALSAQTDVIGSIAARPMLRGLLKPYGIDNPDNFARAIGPRLQTIRLEENSAPILVAEAYDPPTLRKSIAERFGPNAKTEKVDDVDLLLSSSDKLAAAFVDNAFIIGPEDAVRRCLTFRTQKQTISSTERFRRSAQLVDVSRRITAMTVTNDQRAAISFVEAFTSEGRSPFASNGDQIRAATSDLPYAVSASILKGSSIEWTLRSSFGIRGSMLVLLFPENSK